MTLTALPVAAPMSDKAPKARQSDSVNTSCHVVSLKDNLSRAPMRLRCLVHGKIVRIAGKSGEFCPA